MEAVSNLMLNNADIGPMQGEDGQSVTKSGALEPDKSAFQNPRKRKRRAVAKEDDSEEDFLDLELEASGAADLAQRPTKRRSSLCASAVRLPALIYPKSVYLDHEQSVQASVESIVLQEALVSEYLWLQQEMILNVLRHFIKASAALRLLSRRSTSLHLTSRNLASTVHIKLGWSRTAKSRKCQRPMN